MVGLEVICGNAACKHMRVHTARHIQCVPDCPMSEFKAKIAHTPKLALHAHAPVDKLAAQSMQLDSGRERKKRTRTNKEHLLSNAMQSTQRLCEG